MLTAVTYSLQQGFPQRLVRRGLAAFVALVAGWIVYMVAMMMTVYDGLLSMIFQPFVAALCSGLFVLLALWAGLLLRIPALSRMWKATHLWAIGLIIGSLVILSFGASMDITRTFTHPETGEKFTGLHPAAAIAGYFSLLFAIANWPSRIQMKGRTRNERG